MDFKMTDDDRQILNACLDQNETVRTAKTENVFEQALNMESDDFTRFFEGKVKSKSAFMTVLNVPQDESL